ncbi:MAG: acyltransferase family protein, partial [Gemmatimonadaceae bacterium]
MSASATATTSIPASTAVRPMAGVARSGRLAFVDNLRWTMIILVISMHAADTYSPLGNWYYVDRSPLSTPTLLVFAAWQTYLQSFFMGLLFFVAGVFVPASVDRKGSRQFLRDRAFRLGLPVLLYTFVVGPLTEYFVSHSWSATHSTFPREWYVHLVDGEFLGMNGPLWFCLALLIFSASYVALREVRAALPPARPRGGAPGTVAMVGLALAISAGAFALRTVLPQDFTIMNMHVGDFAQYIALFAAGVVTARRGWLSELSFALGMRWLLTVLPIGFAAWLGMFVFRDSLERWHAQTAA